MAYRIMLRPEWGNRYGVGWGFRNLPAQSAWLHHSGSGWYSPNATLNTDIGTTRTLDLIGYQRFNYADKGFARPAGAGISYTHVVHVSGRIMQGHDVRRSSSHTSGHNTLGVGVCVPGNYSTRLPDDVNRLVEALAWLLVEMVRRGELRQPRFNGGHRQAPGTTPTACPGRLVELIPRINARAAQIAAGSKPTPPTPKPVDDPLKGFTREHLAYVEGMLDDLGYEGADVWAKTKAYQDDHGLAVDGLPGQLQTTPHIEDTMSKLPEQTASAVAAHLVARPGESKPTVRADTYWRYAANRGQVQALNAKVDALLAREGVDPVKVGKAIADGIREDIVAAVRESGATATADEIVDLVAARLTGTEEN